MIARECSPSTRRFTASSSLASCMSRCRMSCVQAAWRTLPRFVMAVLVTAIHDFLRGKPDVDGRNKSGHDGDGRSNSPMTGRVLAWRRAHARHPRSHELPDRIRRIAELIEQIAGMFAQHGRMPLDGWTVMVKKYRIAGGAHGAEPWMLHLLRHAAGDDLGMIEHFPVIVHLRAGDASGKERSFQCLRLAHANGRLDHGKQCILMRLAARIGRKPRIAQM